ncbi:MAG: hypothetical protein GY751_08700 [Bacteroidetes bacterium]|nr:hypothetical protein [Bacteroidota bacterium]
MLEEKSPTSYKNCSQCYHPKLFHSTAAAIQLLFKIDKYENQIRSGQFLNVLAGMILLLLIWLLLKGLNWNNQTRVLVFALAALNPKLIAINAQYTNDSFVFLFAAIAITGAIRIIKHNGKLNTLLIITGCIGAGLSKGSGIPLTFAIIIFLGVIYLIRRQKHVLKAIALTSLLFLLIVPYLGNYIENYKDSKQVLGLNGLYSPPPQFFKRSYVDRPGVISIFDSYLTFRFIDLIRNPTISNDHDEYAANRTSIWSQVYGRTFSARFDQWPLSWISLEESVIRTNRLLLMLGLAPLMIWLLGLFISTKHFFKGIRDKLFDDDWFVNLLMLLAASSMITMLLRLTWQHRDFCTMKAIYLWPGLMGFLYLIGTGLTKAMEHKWSTKLTTAGIIILSAASAFEIMSLIDFLRKLA